MEDDETLIAGALGEGSEEFKRQISKAGQQGAHHHLTLWLIGNMPDSGGMIWIAQYFGRC